MSSIKLAPSILAADFLRLGDQVSAAATAGVEYIHIDVMDGRFVPNISIGLPLVQALRPLATAHNLILDVHLMIVEPDTYLEAFAEAGADILTVHVETCPHLHRTVQRIHELGMKAGVALNPATSPTLLEEIVSAVDLVLVMSVNPGFGGQKYIEASSNKIRRVRHLLHVSRSSAELEVDGGITTATIGPAVRAGADVLVAGSAVFNKTTAVADNIHALRHAAANATLNHI